MIPESCRDDDEVWREVLDDWREAGIPVAAAVSLDDALQLLGAEDRSVLADIALAAAAIEAGLDDRLESAAWIAGTDGARHRVPGPRDPQVFVSEEDGLAAKLGLGRLIHPAYLADDEAASAVRTWLVRRRGLLYGDGRKGDVQLLQRLATLGDEGGRIAEPLAPRDLVRLRDALDRMDADTRDELAPSIGEAVTLHGVRYTQDGLQEHIPVEPSGAFFGRGFKQDFATAAGATPGPIWVAPAYQREITSKDGATLGAQAFLRLLGVRSTPGLIPHRQASIHYARDPRPALERDIAGPSARRTALDAVGASHTLHDLESPDLDAVLKDIATDTDDQRRRGRAAALIKTLQRAWAELEPQSEVSAAHKHHMWRVQGTVAAWWFWRLTTIAWLDAADGVPRPPHSLRLRTPSTVAVHGQAAESFVHSHFADFRGFLEELWVAGEPTMEEVCERLRDLRDEPDPEVDLDVETILLYQGLSDRVVGRSDDESAIQEMSEELRKPPGLIYVQGEWLRPGGVFRGAPVFGSRRPFVPDLGDGEALWQRLGVRRPSLEDCVDVLRELAREDLPLAPSDQSILLDTLHLMADLAEDGVADASLRRKLRGLPLLTYRGWVRERPVYAATNPLWADALEDALPVWAPGGDVSQFLPLLPLLDIAETSEAVLEEGDGVLDERATERFRAGVLALQVDLVRNDRETEECLQVAWEDLRRFAVHVASDIRVVAQDIPGHSPLRVPAWLDMEGDRILVRDLHDVSRVDVVGNVVASLFSDRRREARLAWGPAVQRGASADTVGVVETAARVQERTSEERRVGLQERLEEIQQQAGSTRAEPQRSRSRAPADAARTASTGQSTARSEEPRVLHDPAMLRVRGSGTVQVRPPTQQQGSDGGVANSGKSTWRAEPAPSEGAVAPAAASPTSRKPAATYTAEERERVGLNLLRQVLGRDDERLRDVRALRGFGADAVDDANRPYELKVSGLAEPTEVTLQASQVQMAMEDPDFCLVVVSDVEANSGRFPKVRIILDPLHQLRIHESTSVSVSGIQQASSLVFEFDPAETDV